MPNPIEVTETETRPGYRLEYFEVFNWGTFDKTISRLVPDCNSTMLTGANGSGKTTLVDALLTILVPNNKRHYNQSSGNERKKERDENSYVLGYWEKSQDAEMQKSKPLMLRSHDDYSVLLGCFYNAFTQSYVTLVQVRWFSGALLEKRFIVSPHQLAIATHFSNLDKRGDWRKKLKAQVPNTEIGESFTDYSAAFRKYFGMRSDKALNLFNLLVGTKSIDDLNNFIRNNMLEESTAEDDFIELRSNFQALIDTHRSIRKAEKQIELLSIIEEAGDNYTALLLEQQKLKRLIEVINFYYPEQEKVLLLNQVDDLNEQYLRDTAEIENIDSQLKSLRDYELSLQLSRSGNETSKAIEDIDRQTDILNKDALRKEKSKEQFDSYLNKTSYPIPDNANKFLQLRDQIANDLSGISDEITDLDDERTKAAIEVRKMQEHSTELENEISSLRTRRTQIPEKMLTIREHLLNAVDATSDEIPFVGELLRVKPEEKKQWETAIERLLHGFGLSMLVPEKYIKAVNTYVHETRLKGKIVYHKVNVSSAKQIFPEIPENSIREKLDIKDNTLFEGWLENRLREQFDYVCTDNQEQFLREKKALMPGGLHKNVSRHEKDDREHRGGLENHILGWDNREKLQAYIYQFESLKKSIDSKNKKINDLKNNIAELRSKEETYKDILKFNLWLELDSSGEHSRMKELQLQRKKLSESSDALRKLDEEITNAREKIKLVDNKKSEINKRVGSNQKAKTNYENRIKEIEQLFAHVPEDVLLDELYNQLLEYVQRVDDADSLKQLEKEKEATTKYIRKIVEEVDGKLSTSRRALENGMKNFVQPAKKITDDFPDWLGDTLNLEADITYIEEFSRIHKKLKEEGLPAHKKRFRDYMNESVLNRITAFRSSLEERRKDIQNDILQLNNSLQNIDFESYPPTFIQFEYKFNYDPAITKFREELLACIPAVSEEVIGDQQDVLNQAFERIRVLVERLYADTLLRKKVIDVRNWFLFKAQEYYRNDEKKPGRYYEGSHSLSGGQSVQLTYTVIGAAVAYQFGINDDTAAKRSFRFVAVDEAFSNLDQDKSDYLMKFAKQLQLQLLVVTPLDKLHIAEPYIESCHYVVNKERKKSTVYHMPMDEYRRRKDEIQVSEE
jgi:uncharacterized protein YPO0396